MNGSIFSLNVSQNFVLVLFTVTQAIYIKQGEASKQINALTKGSLFQVQNIEKTHTFSSTKRTETILLSDMREHVQDSDLP